MDSSQSCFYCFSVINFKMDCNFGKDLVDILSERRVGSDLVWASRTWNPAVAWSEKPTLNGYDVKSMVLNSVSLKHFIYKVI